MGRYDIDAERWVADERADARARRKDAAKMAMRLAHRPDRPTEAAAGEGGDETRRAARKFVELARHDEVGPKTISSALHLDRRALGHDDDSHSTSRLNASLVDELARNVDDDIEADYARDDEDDLEDFDAWLEAEHGISGEALEAQLESMPEETADALVEALNNDYDHGPAGDDVDDDFQGDDAEFNARLEWLQETYGMTHDQLVEHVEGLDESDRAALLDQLDGEYEQAVAGDGAGSAGAEAGNAAE